MQENPFFNKRLANYLIEMCNLTYDQYTNQGHFNVPIGARFVNSFKAVAFGRREWFGFILETWDSVIIAFRGTQSDPDWIADAEAFQNRFPYSSNSGLVHHGFLSIYESCRDEIFKAYAKLPPYKKLYITGHSLGGALATLHAMDVAQNGHFHQVTMYNYGSPRVGNKQFVSQYRNTVPNSVRFMNTHDLIPMLPPKTLHCPLTKRYWYYRHTPKQVSFSIQEGSISKNHSLETYKEGIGTITIPSEN